jgi:hypothetical protein
VKSLEAHSQTTFCLVSSTVPRAPRVGVVGAYRYLLEDRPNLRIWHTVNLLQELAAYREQEIADLHYPFLSVTGASASLIRF